MTPSTTRSSSRNNYKKNIEDITQGRATSEDMSLYIRNSGKTDPSSAPAGHSALYILAPVANNTSGINWEEHKHAMSRLRAPHPARTHALWRCHAAYSAAS